MSVMPNPLPNQSNPNTGCKLAAADGRERSHERGQRCDDGRSLPPMRLRRFHFVYLWEKEIDSIAPRSKRGLIGHPDR